MSLEPSGIGDLRRTSPIGVAVVGVALVRGFFQGPPPEMEVVSLYDWRFVRLRPSGSERQCNQDPADSADTKVQLEECESGRIGRSRKPLWSQGHRGFESHLLRSGVLAEIPANSWLKNRPA